VARCALVVVALAALWLSGCRASATAGEAEGSARSDSAPASDADATEPLPDVPRAPATEAAVSSEAIADPTAARLPAITDRGAARDAIASVRTAGRGPRTGYDRDRFGQRWTDDNASGTFDHDGCGTRDDVLRRDLTDVAVRPNTQGCVVVSGTLTDPYTAATIAFLKSDADAVQIDHIVPLALAWQMGAAQWDTETRTAFANDPLNLVAVDGPTNASKGDSSVASWLPPNRAVRCSYATRIALVNLRYDLPWTPADRDVALAQCR